MTTKIETLEILKDFHRITGARVSLHDLEFNEVVAYPQQNSAFCCAVQMCEKAANKCREADKLAFETVSKTGEVFTYKCHCGLTETVAPIYNYGLLSGYFMMGQFIDTAESTAESVASKSAEYFSSAEKAKEMSKKIPLCEQGYIDSYINIFKVIAEHLTQTNRMIYKPQKLADSVNKYLNQNFEKQLSLDALARTFGYSRTTISNCFKERFGISIGEHITQLRLKKAENMLLYSTDSVKLIAAECGYSDQNYFTKAFAAKFGMPPTEYRRIHCNYNL